MTEQSVISPVRDASAMPGELTYEYTVQFTGVTSYGAPDLGALLSGAADSPPQGARYDVAFEGPVVGQKLRGTVKGIPEARGAPRPTRTYCRFAHASGRIGSRARNCRDRRGPAGAIELAALPHSSLTYVKQKSGAADSVVARLPHRNARSHADRPGHRCPYAPAMQHSSAADGPVSSTVSHGSRRLQAEEQQCRRRRPDCRCWCNAEVSACLAALMALIAGLALVMLPALSGLARGVRWLDVHA
jgi:hypothetical protein